MIWVDDLLARAWGVVKLTALSGLGALLMFVFGGQLDARRLAYELDAARDTVTLYRKWQQESEEFYAVCRSDSVKANTLYEMLKLKEMGAL